MITLKKKAEWLRTHYKNYSVEWYLSKPERLNAIYSREFKLWLRQQEEAIFAEQQQELDEIGRRMRLAYEAVYHSDFDTDCKLDRVETNKRVQAISELWVTDYVVA